VEVVDDTAHVGTKEIPVGTIEQDTGEMKLLPVIVIDPPVVGILEGEDPEIAPAEYE